jgi:Lon protease-like protein
MKPSTQIPMFPLTILPLPGELVPLHIFEPRYKTLLQDAETRDISFGIYFNHEINRDKIGALMRLESVLKRYKNGEADIIVKCTETFQVEKLYRNYKTKPYPGGDIRTFENSADQIPNQELYELFVHYLGLRNISERYTMFTTCQIAQELNLSFQDRYKFLTAFDEKRNFFLATRLKFQIHLLQTEDRAKNVFHLN